MRHLSECCCGFTPHFITTLLPSPALSLSSDLSLHKILASSLHDINSKTVPEVCCCQAVVMTLGGVACHCSLSRHRTMAS